jgi:hypothetical protein
MNSNRTKAMDMPPCDVPAMVMAEVGCWFQIDDESSHKGTCEQALASIALKQIAAPRRLLQIFRAAAY